MNRRQIVAGNWKMNTLRGDAIALAKSVVEAYDSAKSKAEIIVVPPYPFVDSVGSSIEGSDIKLGAQNCSEHASGAFTGEVSVEMLKSCGVSAVVLGHSERRQYFGEREEVLEQKVKAVLAASMTPIYCCGEDEELRENGEYLRFIESQINGGICDLSEEDILKVVIAYEPVWAIGTGLTASPEQAQEVHAFIRDLLSKIYGDEVADMIPILYGGSVKPSNAKELFGMQDIDGGLIGGAALNAQDFIAIAESF